ncbi:MAG: EexN family lipoprotein [Proteobacteria bacterium]|nr:EexN family lipoprotein [Pseudomonadota bacterium]
MKTLRLTFCFSGLLLVACAKEPPPASVAELMKNPRLLEATMVRCGQNRSETKYLAECVNARDAINRLEVSAKQAKRAELEARSERKRQALRRTQEAAAEARRRTMEAQARREQAEFLGVADDEVPDGTGLNDDSGSRTDGAAEPGGNAPGVQIAPPEAESVEDPAEDLQPDFGVGSDIESIREELKRRQENPQ